MSPHLVKGIASYTYQQKVIKRVIRHEGGRLTAKRFDQIFVAGHWPLSEHTDETIILGGISPSDWACWLELTQIMCSIGIIESHSENTGIVYLLKHKNREEK